MSAQAEKVVIVGYGWVGQANALALRRMGYEVFYYDILTPPQHYSKDYGSLYQEVRPLNTLLEKESPTTWYIVCIGDRVSPEGVQDISLIEKALESLRPVSERVILRSTVLPSHLGRLPFRFYVPEFLHELKAVEECLNPFYFVLGQKNPSPVPSFLIAWQERAHKVFVGTPEEASYIKYLSNIWNAVRVAFVNEFGDSIALPITEADRKRNENILDFILERKSYLRYGKTFGGHCLPKDLRAFNAFKGQTMPIPLLKAAYASNDWHAEIQERYHTLPQWFSAWDYASTSLRPGEWLATSWRKFNQLPLVKALRHALQPARRATERLLPNKSLAEFKNAWNERALKNPYYYSNPDTPSSAKADEFETRRTGQADYDRYIKGDTLLQEQVGDFNSKVVLEIGSGVGRITEFFAKDFNTVHGIDIAPNMLAVASKRLLGIANVSFHETAGTSIPFPDATFDFIFSYQVFKHLSDKRWIEAYFKEIARTLKPGGIAKVQMRTGPDVYRWRWFHGLSVSPVQAEGMAKAAGLAVLKNEKENAKSLWLTIQKP